MMLLGENCSTKFMGKSMSGKKRLVLLVGILTAVTASAVGVGGGVLYALYETAFEERRVGLVDMVKSQVQLIEAMARYDYQVHLTYHDQDHNLGSYVLDAVLTQIRDAQQHTEGFEETGEFTLARLDGDQISFLLRHRHQDLDKLISVPLNSEFAEPMRRALMGESGTVIGLDYRDELVLAAYEPVAELNLGMVAKIDLAEIRAPFIRTGLLTLSIGLVLVMLGTLLFLRVGGPLVSCLEESERKYRAIFEGSCEGILVADIETRRFRYANPAFCRMLGYSEEEITRLGVTDIHPKESLAHVVSEFEAQARGEKNLSSDIPCLRKDGSVVYVDFSSTHMTIDGRECNVGFVRNVTERKRAEERIRFLSLITEQIADSVIATDLDYKITYVNQSFQNLYGYNSEELLGKSPDALNAESNASEVQAQINDAVFSGKVWMGEVLNQKKDGSTFPCELTFFPLADEAGVTFAYAAIQRDITNRKRVEEELVKSEKLESIGVLAGSIAHDFNNILAGVVGNVSLAKEDVEPGSDIFETLDNAETALDRARDLTHQLLTFARGGTPVRRIASVANLIGESARFSLHGSNVKCELNLSEQLHHAEIDAGQISQVLNNLIINADQAMPDGGVITISVENVSLDSNSAVPLDDGEHIYITITDQGIGIPEGYLGRIFDPFFTTKQKGSGLGLASTYSIVKNHGGHIQCESQLGHGTTFHIYLPACRQEVKPMTAAGDENLSGTGRILIMDDEQVVRDVAGKILKRFGYRVDLALDGRQVMTMYTESLSLDDPYDVVILDLTVPGGMGGRETIHELLRVDPDVKALVCSGYSNDPILANYRDLGFRGIISKPFRPGELAKVVRDVISRRQAEAVVT